MRSCWRGHSQLYPQGKRPDHRVAAPVPSSGLEAIGNAAGDGSRMALVSKSFRERAAALPDLVEHVELSTRADFNEEFIKALNFPAV